MNKLREKPKGKRHLYILPIFAILSIFIVFSCDENNGIIEGIDFIDPQTNIIVSDTFTVDLNTIILDSIATSANAMILVGNYQDGIIGNTAAAAYFQLGPPSRELIDETHTYDSVRLLLRFNKYFEGDTTTPIRLSLHKTLVTIKSPEISYNFNKTAYPYEAEPIAEFEITLKPSVTDSVFIKLPFSFGKELYDLVLDNDPVMQSSEAFLSAYPGFVLVPEGSGSNLIAGFDFADNDPALYIYSHVPSAEPKALSFTLNITNSTYQFYNFNTAFDFPALQSYSSQRNLITPAETDGKTMVMGGNAILTRISFPYINELLVNEKLRILKAELILKPDLIQPDKLPAASNLVLVSAGRFNELGSILKDTKGNYLTPQLSYDEFYNENTFYSFNLTYWLVNEIADGYFDPEVSLMLSFETEKLERSVEALILDALNEGNKLKIHYIIY